MQMIVDWKGLRGYGSNTHSVPCCQFLQAVTENHFSPPVWVSPGHLSFLITCLQARIKKARFGTSGLELI